MANDLTILTCNYNTPNEVVKLLKSVKQTSSELPHVIVMNTTTDDSSDEILNEQGIPYFNFRNGIHGEAVNLGLKKVQTRYVLLVDSDVIFLNDYLPAFDKFKELGVALMGKVVGNIGGKELYERVEPWYCFIDLELLKRYKIQFFDRERTIKSKKEGVKVYDIGSTMYEDIINANLSIADVNMEGKYFRHYGGMSWRTRKFDPNQEDTDIDFGGTHPHKILWDIGQQVKNQYESETWYLNEVDIKDLYQ